MSQTEHPTYEGVCTAAEAVGLACRGAFHPLVEDGVPIVDGWQPRTVVLLGFTGNEQWPVFTASNEYHDGLPHPLDRWSKRIVETLAENLGARALFPFTGPPWWPFQRWARRAERLYESPLGILLHPTYGLWHAYRGALLLRGELALQPHQNWTSPCTSCVTTPCLTACPADALAGNHFAAESCRKHLFSNQGAHCINKGCIARYACPFAKEHRYTSVQAGFHVRAFITQHR